MGGTITADGRFTAGPRSGFFLVTATSVWDPTKSATALVTVVAPRTMASPARSPVWNRIPGGNSLHADDSGVLSFASRATGAMLP